MKVLLGIGGTEDSFRALSETVDRTAAVGDRLTIAILDNPASDVVPGEIEDRVRRAIESAGLSAEVRHVTGDAGSRLTQIAETEGFDSIVLGGGEKSPMGKIRLGSIAEFVVLNATVSVTLIR